MNEATCAVPCKNGKIKFSESDKLRFWSKVKTREVGCWEFTGGKTHGGYGKFWASNSTISAHRVSWILSNGDIPDAGSDGPLFVCHKCDNASCVNPDHLFLGTSRENIDDMIAKGRNAKGSANGGSFLSEDEVVQIREIYAKSKTPSRKLAKMFGVQKTTILNILNGRTWKVLDGTCAPPGIKKRDCVIFVDELFRWG